MHRTTDARIVVADQVLAAQGGVFVGQFGNLRGQHAQIGLDRGIVLAGRRHDPSGDDRAVGVAAVLVPADAAGRFGSMTADPCPGNDRHPRADRRDIAAQQIGRQLQGVHRFETAGQEAEIVVPPGQRLAHRLADLRQQLGGPRKELVGIEIQPRQGAHQVGTAVLDDRMQGGGVLHLPFLDGPAKLLLVHVEPLVALDAAEVHGVFVVGAQGDELIIPFELGEGDVFRQEHGHVAHIVQADPQFAGERGGGGRVGRAVESADADAHRMHGPAAQQRHDVIAGLLDPQRTLHQRPMVGGHADGAFETEEVGQVQQEHVQDVAFDPLAAIQHVAQHADRRIHLVEHAHRLLQGVAGTHLVGDRADAADAGRDVGNFLEVAAAQKGLEEAGRLVDFQLQLFHLTVAHGQIQRPFPFHPGQRLHADRPLAAVIALVLLRAAHNGHSLA